MAVVAVMLGRNNPLYAAGACVLFGFADALSVNLLVFLSTACDKCRSIAVDG